MIRRVSYFGLQVVAVALLAVFAGCGGPSGKTSGSGGSSETVTVKGSDTMVILGQRWAEIYMKGHPQAKIQVVGGGSGTGFAALQNGMTDIAQSSRPIKDKERQSIKARFNQEVSEYTVARDGVTIYVHEGNPLKALTMAQLKDLYTGKITNWKQVGGSDSPITLYSRENNSGTYVFFKEHVLKKEDFAISAQTLPGTSAIVNAVSRDKYGIGYGGIAYTKGVKAVPVKKDDESPAVEASLATIQSGAYPLSRPLFEYTVGAPKPSSKAFIDFCLSPEGQKIVKEVDYVPVDR